MARRHILVAGVKGWSLRNIVHSGLLKLISTHADVCVVVQRHRYASIGQLAKEFPSVEFLQVDEIGPVHGEFAKATYPFQNLLALHHDIHIRKNNETFQTKLANGYISTLPKGVRGRAAIALTETLHRLGLRAWLERRVDWAIANHERSRFWRKTLEERRIDTLYLPSTFTTYDHVLASVGRCWGLTVNGAVLSWDNLANKGRLPGPLDHHYVWGPAMCEQLRSYYPHVAEASIHQFGALQFDWHFQEGWQVPRDEFMKERGLNPQRPYVLYASSAPVQAPGEHLIVESLLNTLTRPSLNVRSPQLYLRLHPKDDGRRFDALARKHPHLVIDRPNQTGDPDCWSPDADEIRRLVGCIKHAAVVVNVFSTVTLDAIIQDRPVVNVSWSPNTAKPWPGSLAARYTHFLPVIESGATPVATNETELVEAVARYLDDDSLHRDERLHVKSQVCGQCDGMVHLRIASHLTGADDSEGDSVGATAAHARHSLSSR